MGHLSTLHVGKKSILFLEQILKCVSLTFNTEEDCILKNQ